MEDDRQVSQPLRQLLFRRNWDVRVVETVEQAMYLLDDDSPPDWVVLDLMLPDGDGEQVLRFVRRMHPQVRVAIISGAHEQRLAEVRQLNPDLLLGKPVNIRQLTEALKSVGGGDG